MTNFGLLVSAAMLAAGQQSGAPLGPAQFARLTIVPSFSTEVTEVTFLIGRGSTRAQPIYWATFKEGEDEFSVSSENCPAIRTGLETLATRGAATVSVPGIGEPSPIPSADGDRYTLTASVRQPDGYTASMEINSNGGDLRRWGSAFITSIKNCRPR